MTAVDQLPGEPRVEAAYRQRLQAVHDDVAVQRSLDHGRTAHDFAALERRLTALRDAQVHQFDANVGTWPLRQTLIELASLCEGWAAELPRPTAVARLRKTTG